jgi:hypothetical protein
MHSKAAEDCRSPKRKRVRSSLPNPIQGYSRSFNPIQGVLEKKDRFFSEMGNAFHARLTLWSRENPKVAERGRVIYDFFD